MVAAVNPLDLGAADESAASAAKPELSLVSPPGLAHTRAGEPVLRKAPRIPLSRYLVGILVGLAAAAISVALRLQLGWSPNVLPTFLLIIAVSVVTVAVGLLAGVTATFAGALLTWHYLVDPGHNIGVGRGELAMLGYFSVTIVILATSLLYRLSEQKRRAAAVEMAMQEARHQWLFAREMAHRLKNALSIVQSIAGQTFGRDTPEVAKFEGRLRALADAHNLLNEHVKQPTASIREVVETAIRPFGDRPKRFRVDGPQSALADQQVVSLSLALHELGTNAVKHGALGSAEGWVSIEWRATNEGLRLDWKEHDGPAVSAPKTTGFGSRLLARAAMGSTVLFESDGLRCIIDLR